MDSLQRAIASFCVATAVILASIGSPASATVIERHIAPRATDSRLRPDKWTEDHLVCIDPAVTKRNILFLFFPGTTAHPVMYSRLTAKAAKLGYHAVGLQYPNSESINMDICGRATDSLCYENARTEIWDGVDQYPAVEVDRANSIINRTVKLLQYLSTHYPAEGWGQFLLADTSVNWEKVCASGHSQGGGHAGFAAKRYKLNRCVMFAAMDWFGKPATWIRKPNSTPASVCYGLTHSKEIAVQIDKQLETWRCYGMDLFGPLVNIDTAQPPYGGSHILTSAVPAPDTMTLQEKGGYYHNCLSVDAYLAYLSDGVTPAAEAAWEYMLTHEEATTANPMGGIAPAASFRAGLNTLRRTPGMLRFDIRGRAVGRYGAQWPVSLIRS